MDVYQLIVGSGWKTLKHLHKHWHYLQQMLSLHGVCIDFVTALLLVLVVLPHTVYLFCVRDADV